MVVDFNLLMVVLTIIGAIAGIVIPLHLSGRNTIDAVQKEMKDFHGRLEKQDAEFKAFLKEEERKRTQILMGK